MINSLLQYLTYENIYHIANIGVIPCWLLLIFFPIHIITKFFVKSVIIPLLLSTAYIFIVYQIYITENIFDIFDLYNFTVDEYDPLDIDVAIDPEMLGNVFESLLAADERKSKGIFYTPKTIVNKMCTDSLILYLEKESKKKIDSQIIKDFVLNENVLISNNSLEKYSNFLDNLLLNVKPEITRDIDLQFADFQGTARIFIFSNLRVKKQAKGY